MSLSMGQACVLKLNGNLDRSLDLDLLDPLLLELEDDLDRRLFFLWPPERERDRFFLPD